MLDDPVRVKRENVYLALLRLKNRALAVLRRREGAFDETAAYAREILVQVFLKNLYGVLPCLPFACASVPFVNVLGCDNPLKQVAVPLNESHLLQTKK